MSSSLAGGERSVAETAGFALDGVRDRSPAAVQLLSLCSFLAPDDIPRRLLFGGAQELPVQARAPVSDPLALMEAVGVLRRFSLLHVRDDGLQLHRTVQAVVRDGLGDQERVLWATGAGRIVLRALPERPEDSRHWPWVARLLPHSLTAADHLEALGLEPLLAAMLRDRAARYLAPQGQLQAAQDLLDRSLASLERVHPESALYATILNHRAMVERELGMLTSAKRMASRALAIHQQTAGAPAPDFRAPDTPSNQPAEDARVGVEPRVEDHADVADDLQNLGVIAQRLGDFREAATHLTAAYKMRVELQGPDDPVVADLLVDLFSLFAEDNRRDDAAWALQRATEILEAKFGPTDDDVVTNRQLLSILTAPDTPADTAREVLRRHESMHGSWHPRTADACRLLATLLRRLGQPDEASRMVRRALDIDRHNYGPRHYRLATDLVDLMLVEAASGDLDAGQACLRQATEIILAAPPDERVSTLRLSGLGSALVELAVLDDTRPLIPRALSVLEQTLVPPSAVAALARDQISKALLVSGDVLLRDGRHEDAALQYRDGLRLALLTGNPLDDADFHVRLGFVAAMAEQPTTAVEHFRDGLRCLSDGGLSSPLWALVTQCSSLSGATGRSRAVERALTTLVDEAMEVGAVPQFRAALTAAVPDDWFAKESTTLLAPDGQANIIASSEPLDPSIDTDRYAEIQGDLLRKEFPDFEQKAFESVPIFGGRPGYLRHFEWTPPDGERVAQIQLYYVQEGRGYTATATTPLRGFPERELLLRQLLRSLRIVS